MLDEFGRNSFVMKILQRNPTCKLMKTRILFPKYGWGYLGITNLMRAKSERLAPLQVPSSEGIVL
jgi:hypothetical protein